MDFPWLAYPDQSGLVGLDSGSRLGFGKNRFKKDQSSASSFWEPNIAARCTHSRWAEVTFPGCSSIELAAKERFIRFNVMLASISVKRQIQKLFCSHKITSHIDCPRKHIKH